MQKNSDVVWVGCLVLGWLGCAGPERVPLEPPGVRSATRHYPGSVISGPQADAEVSTAEGAWRVEVWAEALERVPEGVLEPVGPRRRLVIAPGAPEVLRAAPEVAGGRFGAIDDPVEFLRAARVTGGRSVPLEREALAVWAGATGSVTWGGVGGVELRVGRVDGGVDLAARVWGPWGEELHVLERQAGRSRWCLGWVIPTKGAFGGYAGVACAVRIGPAPEAGQPGHAGHEEARRQALADVARARVLAEGAGVEGLTLSAGGVLPAERGLAVRTQRRQALVALAGATGAVVLRDVSLVCAEEELEAWATRAREALASTEAAAPEVVGWALDVATLRALAEASQGAREQGYVRTALVRYAGGVAVEEDTLRYGLERAETRAVWDRFVREENEALLEHHSAQVRARAFAWLQARSWAPRGYSPFDTATERAAVLRGEGGS